MPIGIQVWQRKDGADRNELALAALQVCRVMRGYDDVSSSKLFWGGWNTIALIAEGDDTMFDFRGNDADMAMAMATAGLADLADMVQGYQLGEAKAGQESYERAGRPSGT